jgi:hypothetical protein
MGTLGVSSFGIIPAAKLYGTVELGQGFYLHSSRLFGTIKTSPGGINVDASILVGSIPASVNIDVKSLRSYPQYGHVIDATYLPPLSVLFSYTSGTGEPLVNGNLIYGTIPSNVNGPWESGGGDGSGNPGGGVTYSNDGSSWTGSMYSLFEGQVGTLYGDGTYMFNCSHVVANDDSNIRMSSGRMYISQGRPFSDIFEYAGSGDPGCIVYIDYAFERDGHGYCIFNELPYDSTSEPYRFISNIELDGSNLGSNQKFKFYTRYKSPSYNISTNDIYIKLFPRCNDAPISYRNLNADLTALYKYTRRAYGLDAITADLPLGPPISVNDMSYNNAAFIRPGYKIRYNSE